MTATQLKYLAAALMVVDHVGMLFDPLAPFFGYDDLRRYLLRLIGRLAFPIFAYFAAEACRKTRSYSAYLKRLGVFALLTQIPLYILMPSDGCSVITTFFLASLGIACYNHFLGKGQRLTGCLLLGLCVFLAQPLHGDYGWLGALTVVALYLCGEDRRRQLLALAGCILLYYVAGGLWAYWGAPVLALLRPDGWALFLTRIHRMLPYFRSFLLPYSLLMGGFACLSLLPLSRYNGERGSGNRWFFYWFYPAHLAVLYGLRMLTA